MLLAIGANFGAFNGYLEQGVRTTALLVHIGGAGGTILHSNLKNVLDLGHGLDGEVGQVSDVDSAIRLFVEVKSVSGILGEKIANLLVVDLKI